MISIPKVSIHSFKTEFLGRFWTAYSIAVQCHPRWARLR